MSTLVELFSIHFKKKKAHKKCMITFKNATNST